jgi:hypothetical protein
MFGSVLLTNITGIIKVRRMRRAENVARMGDGRGAYRVLVGKPEGKRPLGRPRCRIIFKRIFKKWDVGEWIGLIWLRTGSGSWHL